MTKIFIILFCLFICPCSGQNENSNSRSNHLYSQYFYNLRDLPCHRIKVYRDVINKDYFFTDVKIDIVELDTIIVQKSYDNQVKYDSLLLRVKNNKLVIDESYFFRPDSQQIIDKVEIIAGKEFPLHATEDRVYKSKVTFEDNTQLQLNLNHQFLKCDTLNFKDSKLEVITYISQSEMFIDKDKFMSYVDSIYVVKDRGVVKSYFGFPEEEKTLLLDTIIDNKYFIKSNYRKYH
jgi:hypothetical protein